MNEKQKKSLKDEILGALEIERSISPETAIDNARIMHLINENRVAEAGSAKDKDLVDRKGLAPVIHELKQELPGEFVEVKSDSGPPRYYLAKKAEAEKGKPPENLKDTVKGRPELQETVPGRKSGEEAEKKEEKGEGEGKGEGKEDSEEKPKEEVPDPIPDPVPPPPPPQPVPVVTPPSRWRRLPVKAIVATLLVVVVTLLFWGIGANIGKIRSWWGNTGPTATTAPVITGDKESDAFLKKVQSRIDEQRQKLQIERGTSQ